MSGRSFSPALFTWLRDLRANNDRTWFEDNRATYEQDVLEPALGFIAGFGSHLKKISPHFVADPRKSGGSLFRIYRDVRFSKDKSPYKTHVGIQFRHRDAKDVHAPGFYLHLEPGNVFSGIGIWHPASDSLRRIRDAIASDAGKWKKTAHGKPFADLYELGGESLKRPPAGYDPEHPFIEDLKRKDFIGVASIPAKAVTSPSFMDDYARMCRAAVPFVRFLCGAVGVPF